MPARLTFAGQRYGCAGALVAIFALFAMSSCAPIVSRDAAARLELIAGLIEEVKSFGKTVGIEPTEALSRTAQQGPPLAMFWLWMQREGTLAVTTPIDIRMAIGYSVERERLKIEQVYRVDGYSVYYRQGNEFADSRSLATVGFAAEPMVRRVTVILHEDLHGDANFALSWEIEEGIVTPLGSLAAVEYFRWKGDEKNLQNALASLNEERQASRELSAFVTQAQAIFGWDAIEPAKEKVLANLAHFPVYQKQFERQVRGQHESTALEAKVSHDLAYYRYFDKIAALAEIAPNLQMLIGDLKGIPANATHAVVEDVLGNLKVKYSAARS
jgi:hypothetical protein